MNLETLDFSPPQDLSQAVIDEVQGNPDGAYVFRSSHDALVMKFFHTYPEEVQPFGFLRPSQPQGEFNYKGKPVELARNMFSGNTYYEGWIEVCKRALKLKADLFLLNNFEKKTIMLAFLDEDKNVDVLHVGSDHPVRFNQHVYSAIYAQPAELHLKVNALKPNLLNPGQFVRHFDIGSGGTAQGHGTMLAI
ncbi:MAG: hypothetical protein KVP17_004149 [Porospora cf. gigantea B]|uniref:uncharacterized protein n=1 Tax=Porospora cf. gigantea B TaxID=2853592 RepID=UPI0035718DD6|nr:MAG: hypothetical protein KVP17_004149 [Porospora cf. gigantea B]